MDNIHEGHRSRLRKNFLATGLAGMQEHEALELLLTYAIPRIDVNPIAHELLNRFGSLANVIDASVCELMQVKYVSENCAVLIKLIPQMYRFYSQSKWKEKPRLENGKKLAEFLVSLFSGCNNEQIYALSLDAHYQLNAVEKLSEGTLDKASLDKRTMMSFVYRTQPKYVVLAHNHPSGNLQPSMADISLTRVMMTALAAMDVVLIDHMIVAAEKTFSFRSYGILQEENRETDLLAGEEEK